MELVAAPGWRGLSLPGVAPEVVARVEAGRGSEFLARPVTSQVSEQELVDIALRTLKSLGVEFGDLRMGRDVSRFILVRDRNLAHNTMSESSGIGVRALVGGFWGFAATNELTAAGVARCAQKAVELARATAASLPREGGLDFSKFAKEPAHRAEHNTAVGICPFTTSASAVAAPLIEAAETALSCESITRVVGHVQIYGYTRVIANTEGTNIRLTHSIVNVEQEFHAVANGTSAYRTLLSPAIAGGLEHFFAADFPGKTRASCADALAKCHAKTPPAGKYDIICDGHHLALTMHESVGHPTELDRVLGYELSLAGGSFASLEKRGTFKYGSPIVNFVGDNRIRFGAQSHGFDDEGVEAQRFPIVSDGIFMGYGTNRETAHRIGLGRSNGTCFAESWSDVPIVRIPNLFLLPGKQKLSLDELIADTKSGILMLGRDSFSIDQMRYNFQFGANMAYRIENGKLTESLRDVIYQSITPEFWGACDAICDESEWQMHGVFNCGKGHPVQTARMMHGAAPTRFRNINVGF
jgi:TldD protein